MMLTSGAAAQEETTPQRTPGLESELPAAAEQPAAPAQPQAAASKEQTSRVMEDALAVSESKCLSSVELLTGFAWGKLRRDTRNYNAFPFMLDLDFDLKPLLKKIGITPSILTEFVVEPFASFVSSPRSNAEIGTAFLVKIGFLPDTYTFQPYFVGGAGMLYMSLHTHEQGTQFNFIEYGGIGARYYFRKDMAFTLEGRFRHLSNAGIGKPNTGINSCFVVSGITKKF